MLIRDVLGFARLRWLFAQGHQSSLHLLTSLFIFLHPITDFLLSFQDRFIAWFNCRYMCIHLLELFKDKPKWIWGWHCSKHIMVVTGIAWGWQDAMTRELWCMVDSRWTPTIFKTWRMRRGAEWVSTIWICWQTRNLSGLFTRNMVSDSWPEHAKSLT